MFAIALKYWRPALALALASGLWVHGQHTGRTSCEGRHAAELARAQAAAFRAAEEASRKEAARLEAEAARDAADQALEDIAYAEPPSSGCGLPASRVLRLRER
jgi:hypothetical protein